MTTRYPHLTNSLILAQKLWPQMNCETIYSLAEQNIILLYVKPLVRAAWRTLLASAHKLKQSTDRLILDMPHPPDTNFADERTRDCTTSCTHEWFDALIHV